MMVIPCNVCIKRFYRAYANVDDDASDEQIIAAVKKEIIEEQDDALCDDPDLEIEEDDIVMVEIDHDTGWSEIV